MSAVWSSRLLIVASAVVMVLVVLALLGDVHAVTLRNYTTYNSTGHVTGNITIDVDDFQTEVKEQMGAVALAVLAFAFIYAGVSLPQGQVSIKMGSWMIGALLGLNAVLMASVNMAEATASVKLMVWVVRGIVIVGFMYLLFRVLNGLRGDAYPKPRQY